tara:strand:+ start:697 stop:2214 length:1518 start_codon:yes stop_codon:yes gene_type:complete
MTLVSRIMGLVRDIVIAHLVGAGASADVFLLANKIPNFLRRLFAEGAFAQAFVPVLVEYKEHHPDDVRLLLSRVAGTLGIIVSMITLVGVIGSPIIAALFANGWFVAHLDGAPAGAKFEMASLLLKWTFPYLWFISFVAFAGSILNTMERFAVSAFTPVFLNIIIISFAIWICPDMDHPEIGLAMSVFVGGLVQFVFQIPFLWRIGFLVKPSWAWHDAGVMKIRKLMIPALFGVSVSQINLLLDTVIASYLITGSISWLYYADRLMEFPLGVFGIAIATVILPTLSTKHTKAKTASFSQTMDWGVRSVCALGLPAMVGLILLAKPTLMVLFMRGAFSEYDVAQSSMSLVAYMLGLLNFMLIKIFATGFYSRQDTKSPVKYGIVAMVCNMVFNLIFAYFLGYVGLALATSLSALVNMVLLYRGLVQSGAYQASRETWIFLSKAIVCVLLMASVVAWLNPDEVRWLAMSSLKRLSWLLGLIAIGALVYVLSFILLKGHKAILRPIKS